MKIAVCATAGSLEAPIDPRFGRCATFVVVDADTLEFEVIQNPAAASGQGAGIQAAQLVSSKTVSAVIAGNFGPNAHQALSAAGIKVYTGASGSVRDAMEQYKAGGLQEAASATVAAHSGGGQSGMGRGIGRGLGRGRGRSAG